MDVKCSDCGFAAAPMSPETLAKGSSVREPGEPLCASCSSSRIRLVRAVGSLPASLADIKAKRLKVSA